MQTYPTHLNFEEKPKELEALGICRANARPDKNIPSVQRKAISRSDAIFVHQPKNNFPPQNPTMLSISNISQRIKTIDKRIIVLFISLLLLLSGCSSSKYHETENSNISSSKGVKTFPPPTWQFWSEGSDINGEPINNRFILQGDEFVKRGRFAEGIKNYYLALKNPIPESEYGAAHLRIVSAQLSLGKGENALRTLGKYLERRGIKPDNVDFPLAVLLGYGYASSRNFDQSFAWFSQAANLGANSSKLIKTTNSGISFLLRSIPDNIFSNIVAPWKEDKVFQELISIETARRIDKIKDGGVGADNSADVDNDLNNGTVANLQSSSVLAFLPLSGQHESLGRSAKKGIDLAVEQLGNIGLKFRVIDTGSDPRTILPQLESEINQRPVAVIGPLLAEHAAAVSRISTEDPAPVFHLSKKGVSTDRKYVYQFGVNPKSQMDRLIGVLTENTNVRRLGVVYPNDQSGRDFKNAFERAASSAGRQLVFVQEYSKSVENSINEAVDLARKFEIDAIFIPDRADIAAKFFAKLANPKVIPLGATFWGHSRELKQSAAIFEGAVFVVPFFLGNPREDVQQFIKSFSARFGHPPDLLAAQSYDLAKMIAVALQTGNSSQALVDKLGHLGKYKGVTGKLIWDSDANLRREYDVLKFSEGNFTILEDKVYR